MTSHNQQWMVVTDLDGTMMSHDNYSMEGIQETVALLGEKNIPVVFNTSKTYAETRLIQQKLGITDPMIVENGSCLYLPHERFEQAPDSAGTRDSYWSVQLGQSQQHIGAILEKMNLPDGYYTRLSQCSVEQAVALTGLTQEQAEQAIAREFSEPIIWHAGDDAKEAFKVALASQQLTTLQGGRFLHCLGQCDKGMAMQRLLACYDDDIKTIVLGDSANDIDMLSLADVAIIINSPANHHIDRRLKSAITIDAPAPAGWIEAINKTLLHNNTNQEPL
jgi:mannosyl-3-phosphoglycerate phosphatase family protein